MNELIGAIGLPGALAAVVVAFFYGVKTVQTLRNGRSGYTADLSYKEAMAMSQSIVGVVDKAKDVIQADVAKTRHDVRNDLTIFGGKLENSLERGFDRVVDKLEKVEEAVRELKHG